jgi:tellurite resistance protein
MVQQPTDSDWILKAMVAVAAADGRLDAREVGLIQKVYQDQTGRSVEVSGVVLAVQAYATKRDVLVELSVAAGSMSEETKEAIIRAAYLTLLADKRIAEEERKRLKGIADALQISEIQFQAILVSAGPTQGEESSESWTQS